VDSPSAERNELHEIDDDDACALVDATLGKAEEWRALIVQYRFRSDFQAHWKAEIGHWLNTARRCGYLDRLVERVRARANNPACRISASVTIEDPSYRVLLEEVHPAMVAHYLLRTGWGFRAWDTPDGAGGDVDLAVTAPSGEPVDIQIKVPGTQDPLAALEKAARQLRGSPNRTMVVVCSRDQEHVSCSPEDFIASLIGISLSQDGSVHLSTRGRFASPEWSHVGAVVFLDYLPGLERQNYCCTVVLNPWCKPEAKIERDWFLYARVLRLDGDRFRWDPVPPTGRVGFPDGTYVRLVENAAPEERPPPAS
jgi:hypothetical protein